MKRIIFSLVFVTFSSAALAQIPEFTCDISTAEECLLTGLNLTRDEPEFDIEVPLPAIPGLIRKFEIQDSTIPVLIIKRVCKELPLLWTIRVNNAEVEEVQSDTFEGCNRAIELYLTNNKIKTLPSTMLNNMPLNVVSFANNSIREIPETLFSSKNGFNFVGIKLSGNKLERLPDALFENVFSLGFLALSDNKFQEVPYQVLNSSAELTSFLIYSNDITSIDIDRILKASPALQYFEFNDNYLRCEEQLKLVEFLEEREILTGTLNVQRKRFVPIEEIGQIRCLGEVEWAAVYYNQRLDRSSSACQCASDDSQELAVFE